ncbi:hypothetical protein F7725_014983 [Dissostichus mawsoni]|uniref:Uncharacterized protein n=1 Tax=Dissostichus mawsoni TaxID=36200 RepID=A0A7J5YG75_DISMA|nr:hypothetical protein F7725_014983 [Dissostichus mawsoni]
MSADHEDAFPSLTSSSPPLSPSLSPRTGRCISGEVSSLMSGMHRICGGFELAAEWRKRSS